MYGEFEITSIQWLFNLLFEEKILSVLKNVSCGKNQFLQIIFFTYQSSLNFDTSSNFYDSCVLFNFTKKKIVPFL